MLSYSIFVSLLMLLLLLFCAIKRMLFQVANKTYVKKQVLFDSECSDEYVILLHVAAERCDVLNGANLVTVDSNRAIYLQ